MAEVGIVIVAGSFEDTRGFSAMGFMKNKLRNTLDMCKMET